MTNKTSKYAIVGIGGALAVWALSVAIARIMVPDRNPAARYSGAIVDAEVDAVLRRACFDCHSNETRWPWYTHLPLASVLIARDVREGRREVNFSVWDTLSADKRAKALRESAREVKGGKMPMPIYLPLHPEARLTDAEKTLFVGLSSPRGGGDHAP